jgi:titin
VSVSWSVPDTTGGEPITGYVVTSTPDSIVINTTEPTAVVTGLVDGVTYVFTVQAMNATGTGPASVPSNSVTPRGVPGTPLDVTATAGDTIATVSWQAPADDGASPITGYNVTAEPGGVTLGTSATTLVFPGLTNGTAYTFVVQAGNAIGLGPISLPSASVTPLGIPGMPTAVIATPGDAQATLTWAAPANTGGEITDYLVIASPGSLMATTTGGTSATVTGLTNGTSYTFVVMAMNAAGTGPASAPSNAVVPCTIPAAPTGVVASLAGSGEASVTWAAPVDDGGAPILRYTVTASPGGATATTSTGTTVTVTGLTNGTSYSFTVVAANSAGTGPASAPSNAFTPITAPAAPTNVSGQPGDQHVTVSWLAPASLSPILGYVVTATPGGVTLTTTGATSVVFTGLTNGTSYTFAVVATNAAGTGPAGTSPPVIPVTVPGAPTISSVTPGNGKVTVAWTAPASDGGTPTTGYILLATQGTARITTTGATTATMTGLVNGQAYTFTVAAMNAVGTGPASIASAPATPFTVPTAPQNVAAVPGDGQAVVSWSPPLADNGSPVTSYAVTTNTGQTTVSTTTSTTVQGLTNGLSYMFTVTASNAAGAGPASAASAAVVPVGLPGMPTNVFATAEVGSAAVSWTAPASNGGTAITSYLVTLSPGGTTMTVANGLTTATFTGLAPGESYTFVVSATNAVGSGPTSRPSPLVTLPNVPDAPTGVMGVPGNRQATVSWTAPANNGSPITSYIVTTSPGGTMTTTNATTCTVTGLSNGASYTFSVVAVNAVGPSAPSQASSAVTLPLLVPTAPLNIVATAGIGQATISWSAPASNGGTSITGYAVTVSPPGTSMMTTTNTSITVSNLLNGGSYVFTVAALNSVGTGPTAPSNTITLPNYPQVPTGVSAVGTNTIGEVIVSWTAPASDGGLPITEYTVMSSPDGVVAVTSGATSTAVSGLTNGAGETFIVFATNAVGDGAVSSPSAAITIGLPGAPTNVAARNVNGQANITWNAPPVTGGNPITGYTVTCVQTGTTVMTTGALSATVSGLMTGADYSFTVVATNVVGNGPVSAPSASVLIATVPGVPADLVVTGTGCASASLQWMAPAAGGSPITGYTIVASDGSTLTTTSTSGTITNLTSGSEQFEVYATNAAGSGSPTGLTSAVTIATEVPGAPTNVSVTETYPYNETAVVRWTLATGGGIVMHATAWASGGQFCNGDIYPNCTLSALTQGNYTIWVTATNTCGTARSASVGYYSN